MNEGQIPKIHRQGCFPLYILHKREDKQHCTPAVLSGRIGFTVFLTFFRKIAILELVMQSKTAQITALLQGKTVFYVNIETPDGQDSITETTLESPKGIAVSAEGDTLTFTAEGKTAAFVMLENAQILTNRTEEADIIVTLATNGGLQIKSRF
jgi:hypothetical protein